MEVKPPDSQVPRPPVSPEDAVRVLLAFIGEDPGSEHCLDTPTRVVKSFSELFGGYKMTPEKALGTTFKSQNYNQMVVLKDIELYSTCSHHMIPFFGKAHIGYIPGEKIVGLSKLARLIEVYSRRLQVQERLTDQVASAIEKILAPKGVMVVVQAKHLCMCARGIGKQHSEMVTSAIRGAFEEASARAEFMSLISR